MSWKYSTQIWPIFWNKFGNLLSVFNFQLPEEDGEDDVRSGGSISDEGSVNSQVETWKI